MINKILKLLTIGLFISIGLGQLTRFLGFIPGVNLYLFDILTGLIATIYFLSKKPNSNLPLSRSIITFIFIAFLSLVFSISRFSVSKIAISSLYLLRLIAYFSLYWVFNDKSLKLDLVKYLKTTTLIVAILGIAQYLLLPDTRFLSTLGWDDHYYRVISTLGDPGQVGLVLLLGLILNYFTTKSHLFNFLVIVPLFLTYSRSTFLSLVAVIVYITVIKKNWRSFIISLTLVILALLVLPNPGGEGVNLVRIYSIIQRQENWSESLLIAKNHPIIGVGYNTLRYTRNSMGLGGAEWQTSHSTAGVDSSLLFVLVTTGLLGLIFFILLYKKYLHYNSLLARTTLLAVIVHSLFQNSWFYSITFVWLWSLTAIKESS